MKTAYLSALALSFSVSAFAHASNVQYKKFSVPAEGILDAVSKIKSQTISNYPVRGDLRCNYIGIHSPFHNLPGIKLCSIKVQDDVVPIGDSGLLFDELVKVKPALASQSGFFEAPFSVEKVVSQFPPYGATVTTNAEVYLKVIFSGESILDSVFKLVPMTSPGYVVDGRLACTEDLEKVPPMGDYMHNQKCVVQVNDKNESVENTWEIMNILHETSPLKSENWTGKQWSFSNKFTAYSFSSEAPPYKTTQHVEIQLYK